jgi:DNA-binding NarL/FixJ family response regulator
MEINTKYETEKKDKELILKNKKIEIMNRDEKIARIQRIALSGGLFLLMIIGFFVFINMRNKMKKDKEIMEKNNQLFETKNALIQAELEYKNKHVMDMGIQIVNKNNMLQEITENITEIKSALQKEEKENAINKLESLSKIMGINLKIDIDHEEFNKHLELVNEGFYFKLNQKFPDLSDYEKRLASLLKMNLSSNEISVLLNISPSSVNISRYRLRKKLNLEEKENINDFLNKV